MGHLMCGSVMRDRSCVLAHMGVIYLCHIDDPSTICQEHGPKRCVYACMHTYWQLRRLPSNAARGSKRMQRMQKRFGPSGMSRQLARACNAQRRSLRVPREASEVMAWHPWTCIHGTASSIVIQHACSCRSSIPAAVVNFEGHMYVVYGLACYAREGGLDYRTTGLRQWRHSWLEIFRAIKSANLWHARCDALLASAPCTVPQARLVYCDCWQ